jgi:hypothetical protein
MAGISLSYCQLIKIVLSQIGGNPLQQVYTQLSQGARQVTAGTGIIPSGLTEIKNAIDTITNAINTASGAVATAQETMERVAGQLYQNPMGTILLGTIDTIEVRIARIDIRVQDINANVAGAPTAPFTNFADELASLNTEKSNLNNTKGKLQTYKNNTDILSGVATLSGSEAGGGCSLQDLLGSGCTPNDAVPDIDLKSLTESINQGDLVAAIRLKIQNATGYSDYSVALNTFNNTIQNFISSFNNALNKAAIRNAVTAQITQIVYNLLSGCSGEILDLTLKPEIKTAVAGYVAIMENQASGNAYVDSNGNVEVVTNAVVTPVTPPVNLEAINNLTTIASPYEAYVNINGDTKYYNLGTTYTSANDAAKFLEGELTKSGVVSYIISIYKDGKVLARVTNN